MAVALISEETEYRFMGFRIDYSAYRAFIDDVAVHLTPIEYKIVEFYRSTQAGC
jgi:DNA-binding response OmpR family regulator